MLQFAFSLDFVYNSRQRTMREGELDDDGKTVERECGSKVYIGIHG
jgi:hypothetical protein